MPICLGNKVCSFFIFYGYSFDFGGLLSVETRGTGPQKALFFHDACFPFPPLVCCVVEETMPCTGKLGTPIVLPDNVVNFAAWANQKS